jgi:hypothetical protein
MTRRDHHRLAEELLSDRGVLDAVLAATAQVHAVLMLAAATAMSSDFGNRTDAWGQAAGSTITS